MIVPLRLIVFDMDGTLVDSGRVICDAMDKAFAACGLPSPGDEATRRIIGLRVEEAVAVLAPHSGPDMVERLTQQYKQAYHDARTSGIFPESLYPGVATMLAQLQGIGFTLGVATGKSRRGLDAALERYDLARFFSTLQTADEPPGKPHPAMLLRAVDEAGVDAHETAMVGDTTYDVLMARAAGARAVGVPWGFHQPEELASAGAELIIGDWPDLNKWAGEPGRA